MKLAKTLGMALAAAALAGGGVACNAVLGIDSAQVDPSLSADAGGDAASPDANDGAIPQTCDFYCATIMQNCTGGDLEYIDQPTCVAMCSHFDPGLPGDESGNSLACRIYHAMAAAGDPDVHCRHAGPVGGGTCGPDPCQAFCLLDNALCGSTNPPPYPGGEIGCDHTCDMADAGYDYLATGDAGDISFQSGNTLNCRIYHLEAAYNPNNQPAAEDTHCPHTAEVSAVCN